MKKLLHQLSYKLKNTKLYSILFSTVKELNAAQIPLNASALAYTTILSLVPLLAMSFAVFQGFGGLDKAYEHIQPFILNHLAENAGKEVIQYLEKFIKNIHGGALGVSGFIALVFTSMSMLSNIENTFNRVWNSHNKRSLFQRITNYWFFITLGPILLSVVIGIAGSSAANQLEVYFPKGIFNFIFTFILLFLIYIGVPTCKVHIKPAMIAAFYATLLWYLGNKLFIFYTQKALTYNKIYGSLGVIPLFFLWIYIMWLIILSGVALSYVVQTKIKKGSSNNEA